MIAFRWNLKHDDCNLLLCISIGDIALVMSHLTF